MISSLRRPAQFDDTLSSVFGPQCPSKGGALMTQRERTENDVKQLPLRLDRELYQELSRRSTIENRSMSDIVRDALRAHFDAVRITKPQLRAAIERIAPEDAES